MWVRVPLERKNLSRLTEGHRYQFAEGAGSRSAWLVPTRTRVGSLTGQNIGITFASIAQTAERHLCNVNVASATLAGSSTLPE